MKTIYPSHIKRSRFLSFHAILLAFIFSFSGCLSYKPIPGKVTHDFHNQYELISKPYYKKKVTPFGNVMSLGMTLGGATVGYLNPDVVVIDEANPTMNRNAVTALGAVAGFTLSRIFLEIGGNNRVKRVKHHDEFAKWLNGYNSLTKNDLILINDSLLGGDTAIWTIHKNAETTFIPHYYEDFIYFTKTFPKSPETGRVISLVANKVRKEQLKEILIQYSNQEIVSKIKQELILNCKTQKEMVEWLDLFPELQGMAEQPYSRLLKNYEYLKDFMKRYPESRYLDSAIIRSIDTYGKSEMDELRLNPFIRRTTAELLELGLIEYSQTWAELSYNLDRFHSIKFPVRYDAKIEDLAIAKKTYKDLLSYNPRINFSGLPKVAEDLKTQHIIRKMEYPPDLWGLFETIKSDRWFKDIPLDLFDTVAFMTARYNDRSVFSGNTSDDKPIGKGKLYFPNGDISEGSFVDGHLTGYGYRKIGGDLFKGIFSRSELNGEGTEETKAGTVLTGTFKNNFLEGTGQITYKDGRYEKGNFHQNRLEGIGERKFNSFHYYGSFTDGYFSGEGKYQWLTDTGKWYKGQFSGGKRNGHGILHTGKGIEVEGTWKDDCPDSIIIIRNFSISQKSYLISGTWTVKDCIIIDKATAYENIQAKENDVMEKLALE